MFIKSYSLLTPAWVYITVSAILLVLGTYIWQYRNNPGIKYQTYVQYCKSLGLMCFLLFTTKTSLAEQVLWFKLFMLIFFLVPYFWLLFLLNISNQPPALISRYRRLFALITLVMWVVILTDGWHQQLSQQIWTDSRAVRVAFSNLYMLMWFNGYLMYGISFYFAFLWVYRSAGLRRMQAAWFTFAGALSILDSVVNSIPALVEYSPLLISFVLSALAISWGCYRWHAHSVVTLAEKALVQQLFDGFIVVDAEGYIVTMNSVARKMLADLPIRINRPLAELLTSWPSLLEQQEQALQGPCEIEKHSPDGKRYYQLVVTILYLRDLPKGKVLLLKDITEEKRNQEQLLEQQKALSILRERERLGRELHDGQGQVWNYLGLELSTLSVQVAQGNKVQAHAQLQRLLKLVQEQNADVRESIASLRCTRTATDADSLSYDFIQHLQEYLRWYEQQHRIAVDLALPPTSIARLFEHTSSVQVLRIIQEALTNIRKHAKATLARVHIEQTPTAIYVRITDNGCGFDVASHLYKPKSFGLQIMQERAQESGGQLTIQSTLGGGTEILLAFALTNKEESAMSGESR